MNFALDDDLLALVDSIAQFFQRRADARAIAEAAATSVPTADRGRWAALCEMGLPVLRLAEPDGVGAGLLGATAVAEKLGAVLVPEPAVGAIVLACAWSSHPQAGELLEQLCNGSRITALCGFDTVELAAGKVSGSAQVPDDGVTDAVALLARGRATAESAIVIIDKAAFPPPISRTAVDPTRPTAMITLDHAEPVAVLWVSDETAETIRRELTVLTTAELVGAMHQALGETLDYVKSRQQFGRPIGSFQAIKHRLADMFVATEQARAAVQFAALECAAQAGSAPLAVASAARWVPRAAVTVFEDAIHLQGAMGYSWEVDAHLRRGARLQLSKRWAGRTSLRRSAVHRWSRWCDVVGVQR